MVPRPTNYQRRDPDRGPTHPGAVLRDIVFPELRVSKAAIAEAMNISRSQLYLILGEKQRVTPDTGVRLALPWADRPVCGSTCRAALTYGIRAPLVRFGSILDPSPTAEILISTEPASHSRVARSSAYPCPLGSP
jgi:addiction module HigA family antidote